LDKTSKGVVFDFDEFDIRYSTQLLFEYWAVITRVEIEFPVRGFSVGDSEYEFAWFEPVFDSHWTLVEWDFVRRDLHRLHLVVRLE